MVATFFAIYHVSLMTQIDDKPFPIGELNACRWKKEKGVDGDRKLSSIPLRSQAV